jgi:hypothetical protein
LQTFTRFYGNCFCTGNDFRKKEKKEKPILLYLGRARGLDPHRPNPASGPPKPIANWPGQGAPIKAAPNRAPQALAAPCSAARAAACWRSRNRNRKLRRALTLEIRRFCSKSADGEHPNKFPPSFSLRFSPQWSSWVAGAPAPPATRAAAAPLLRLCDLS